jgi:hypothetical protein
MNSLTRTLLILTLMLGVVGCRQKSGNAKPDSVDYYTCTMHPSVHAKAPGKCPICGMELVPVMKKSPAAGTGKQTTSNAGEQAGHGGMSGMPGMGEMSNMPTGEPNEFIVPIARQQQIGVTYATVERRPLHHTIRAIGTV